MEYSYQQARNYDPFECLGNLSMVDVENIQTQQNIDYLEHLSNFIEKMNLNPLWYEKQTSENKLKILQIYQLSINYAKNLQATYQQSLTTSSQEYQQMSDQVISMKKQIRQHKLLVDQLKETHRRKKHNLVKFIHSNLAKKIEKEKYQKFRQKEERRHQAQQPEIHYYVPSSPQVIPPNGQYFPNPQPNYQIPPYFYPQPQHPPQEQSYQPQQPPYQPPQQPPQQPPYQPPYQPPQQPPQQPQDPIRRNNYLSTNDGSNSPQPSIAFQRQVPPTELIVVPRQPLRNEPIRPLQNPALKPKLTNSFKQKNPSGDQQFPPDSHQIDFPSHLSKNTRIVKKPSVEKPDFPVHLENKIISSDDDIKQDFPQTLKNNKIIDNADNFPPILRKGNPETISYNKKRPSIQKKQQRQQISIDQELNEKDLQSIANIKMKLESRHIPVDVTRSNFGKQRQPIYPGDSVHEEQQIKRNGKIVEKNELQTSKNENALGKSINSQDQGLGDSVNQSKHIKRRNHKDQPILENNKKQDQVEVEALNIWQSNHGQQKKANKYNPNAKKQETNNFKTIQEQQPQGEDLFKLPSHISPQSKIKISRADSITLGRQDIKTTIQNKQKIIDPNQSGQVLNKKKPNSYQMTANKEVLDLDIKNSKIDPKKKTGQMPKGDHVHEGPIKRNSQIIPEIEVEPVKIEVDQSQNQQQYKDDFEGDQFDGFDEEKLKDSTKPTSIKQITFGKTTEKSEDRSKVAIEYTSPSPSIQKMEEKVSKFSTLTNNQFSTKANMTTSINPSNQLDDFFNDLGEIPENSKIAKRPKLPPSKIDKRNQTQTSKKSIQQQSKQLPGSSQTIKGQSLGVSNNISINVIDPNGHRQNVRAKKNKSEEKQEQQEDPSMLILKGEMFSKPIKKKKQSQQSYKQNKLKEVNHTDSVEFQLTQSHQIKFKEAKKDTLPQISNDILESKDPDKPNTLPQINNDILESKDPDKLNTLPQIKKDVLESKYSDKSNNLHQIHDRLNSKENQLESDQQLIGQLLEDSTSGHNFQKQEIQQKMHIAFKNFRNLNLAQNSKLPEEPKVAKSIIEDELISKVKKQSKQIQTSEDWNNITDLFKAEIGKLQQKVQKRSNIKSEISSGKNSSIKQPSIIKKINQEENEKSQKDDLTYSRSNIMSQDSFKKKNISQSRLQQDKIIEQLVESREISDLEFQKMSDLKIAKKKQSKESKESKESKDSPKNGGKYLRNSSREKDSKTQNQILSRLEQGHKYDVEDELSNVIAKNKQLLKQEADDDEFD